MIRYAKTYDAAQVCDIYNYYGYFCPTPRKDLIDREGRCRLISRVSELGEEAPDPSDGIERKHRPVAVLVLIFSRRETKLTQFRSSSCAVSSRCIGERVIRLSSAATRMSPERPYSMS
jgi:hypothetical protein